MTCLYLCGGPLLFTSDISQVTDGSRFILGFFLRELKGRLLTYTGDII